MLAEVHGTQPHDSVHVVGSGNADNIDSLFAFLKHFSPIGVGLDLRVTRCQFFSWSGIYIGGCYELHFWVTGQ